MHGSRWSPARSCRQGRSRAAAPREGAVDDRRAAPDPRARSHRARRPRSLDGGLQHDDRLLNDGTPALLIPRSGPSAEQRIRASLFAQREWVHWLDPDLLGTSVVAEAIVAALSTPLCPTQGADLDGRETAVARLTSRLEGWPKFALEPVGT